MNERRECHLTAVAKKAERLKKWPREGFLPFAHLNQIPHENKNAYRINPHHRIKNAMN